MLLFDFFPFSPNTLLRGKNNKKYVIMGKKTQTKGIPPLRGGMEATHHTNVGDSATKSRNG